MIKRFALRTLFISMIVIAAAYAAAFIPGGAPGWAAWLMAMGIATSFVSMIALGAARDGSIGTLAFPLGLVFTVLAGGFGLALALPEPTLGAALWLGLPPAAAVVFYGVGLLPLLGVPFAYALTFDRMTLSTGDLERVRAAAAELRRRADGRGLREDESGGAPR